MVSGCPKFWSFVIKFPLRHHMYVRVYMCAISDSSSRIEVELSPGGLLPEAVRYHGDLASLAEQLQSSQCVHLVQYATSSRQAWGDRLREKVVK